MRPRFRFTLGGNKVISTPIGWKDIDTVLERDMNYHSLVEMIEVPIEFYGRTSTKDGGYEYLKDVRSNGIDTQCSLLIEISFDGTTYEEFYTGLLDLTALKEIEHKKKFQCTILQTSLWAKFINRKATPVDIQKTTAMDGGAISVIAAKTLTLLSQTIRQTYRGDHFDNVDYATTTVGGFIYGVIDFENETLDEIEDKFNYTRVATNDVPFEFFTMKYGGSYSFDSSITLTTNTIAWGFPVNSDVYFQINNATPIAFTRTDLGTPGVDGRTNFTYTATHTLTNGDEIRIYIQSADPCSWPGSADTNFLEVIGDTEFADSTAPAFPVHDVGLSIVNRITDRELSFYSEYFGGTNETAIPYASDGAGLDHVLLKGLHVRGYSLADKPFAMSFDEWWDGVNPIFNLGLGYDGSRIRCEQKSFFYDDSSQSVTLRNVNNIEISFDADFIQTSIKIGYQEWEAESASGIDDPQTVHTYSTRFKTVGTKDKKDMQILSTMYAASLGIEQTRRTSQDLSRDWRLDEEFMIIQADLTSTTASPVLYTTPTYTITDLLNSATRYNVRLTPATNLYRWKPFLNVGMNGYFVYSSDFYKFQSGEGNTDMTFDYPAGPGGTLPNYVDEGADILVDTETLFKNVLYRFTHPLSWAEYKEIRGDRTKSIAVRYYANDGLQYEVIGFIKRLKFTINKGKADFEVWPKTINVI